MTTKPKAQKFRIRRTSPLVDPAARATHTVEDADIVDDMPAAVAAGGGSARPMRPAAPATPAPRPAPRNDADMMFDNHDDGFTSLGANAAAQPQAAAPQPKPQPQQPQPQPQAAHTGDITGADEMSLDQEIDAIRREGLTGRQLRMARRVAQKHGLAATSDFDAVRLLRREGIDPFQRSTMLELVQPAQAKRSNPDMLPQTVQKPQLPSTNVVYDEAQRSADIRRIQRDIARRRRRKSLLLITRLSFFVLLPTAIAGWYNYFIAHPMYATHSEFVIQQAEPAGMAGMGGLFSGTSFATSQDSIAVQSYLQSRDAMLRLDRDLGFKAHFSNPDIDAIQRLPEGASNEEAYKVFKDRVTIGYDPTEGIIKMEVVAADGPTSQAFSEALINYAEERVDQLTQRLREDQMQGSVDAFNDSEIKMRAAQQRVLELQEDLGVLDPASESGAVMSQVTAFETQLQEKKLQLQQLLDNTRPNQARVDGVRGDIRRLENLISDLRDQLTTAGSATSSLASVTSQLRIAEVDLQTRQMMMQQSLQQLETARIEANRQVRYLSEGVTPVAPDEPTYPRKFENTILAFLIFSGIYLMASLTASVLREQVTA